MNEAPTQGKRLEDEPFWAMPARNGWGVFCLDEDRQEDEVTNCLKEAPDQAFAQAMAMLLNAAYSAGYSAGADDARALIGRTL